MVFLSLTVLLSFLIDSLYSYLIISSFIFYLYFSSTQFSINSWSMFDYLNCDESSIFIMYMTFMVLFLSSFFTLNLNNNIALNLNLLFILISCFMVFSTNNLFLIYLFYEASLIPILFIILNWGSYPERSTSALILLFYTAIFSLPFLVVVFYTMYTITTYNVFILPFILHDLPSFYSLIIFLAFAVKLPLYGIHFWLPMAHVEAPTFGSIILAGVLLKLGGIGLIRLSPLINSYYLATFLLSYLAIFLVVSTVVCCFQSDLNRLVAYSSVSHIIAIPILLLSGTSFSYNSLVLVIFFHGLSSPVLFILVGLLYSIYATRQLVSMRGLLLISPILSFILVIAFLFTLSAPPFPSFLSEVFFFISSYFISPVLLVSFILFSFLSLVYNLNWLSTVIFNSLSSSLSVVACSFSFSTFYPLIFSLMVCLTTSFIIPFF